MGVDTNLHIGPYMVVNGEKKKEIDCNVMTCSNVECKIHKNNKEINNNFCSECGAPVKLKNFKEISKVTAYSLLEDEFLDDLCHVNNDRDKTEIFVSNKNFPFDKGRKVEEYQFSEIDLRNVNSEEEINLFKNEFEKIISCFEENFGKESIEFKWGIIQWFS